MSKHIKVDGKLLQVNKSYNDLKMRQKEKIAHWMYEAYVLQTEENLSDFEALGYIFDKIEEAEIWIPDYEIEKRYRAKKRQFRKK